MNTVDCESAVHLDLLAGNTYIIPTRIVLVAYVWVSAITIINYNQPAPMYTPKLQYIEFRSDDLDLIEMDPTLNLRNN